MPEFTHKRIDTNGITHARRRGRQRLPRALLPRLSRALVLVAPPDCARSRPRASAPSRPISAATARPTRRRRSTRTPSITSSATSPACSTRWASSKAAIVGHDWGGLLVWQMALLAPHRVAASSASTRPSSRACRCGRPTMMRAMAQGNFHYVLYFQEPGVAEAELNGNVRRALRGFYQEIPREIVEASRRHANPACSARTRAACSIACPTDRTATSSPPTTSRSSRAPSSAPASRGGLNWYRNFDRNWETTAYLNGAKVMQPALMITAELDPVLRPEMAAGMSMWVPNLRDTRAGQGLRPLDAAGEAGGSESGADRIPEVAAAQRQID